MSMINGLLPPYILVHLVVGMIGSLIMVYTFEQRLLKEDLLVSEVLAATALGVLLGPIGGVFLPTKWFSSTDDFYQFFQEVMRLVLAIQLVAAAMGLPLMYVEKQWKSLAVLLGPVMVIEWGLSFVFTWLLFSHLGALKCLIIAACLTPTDPVLASVLNLRESAANDGSALPFVMLPILLLQGKGTKEAFTHWFSEVWLYQVGLAIFLGLLYGLCARCLQWVATKRNLQDEPSFLAHLIGLALGIVGFVRATGSDGVLAVFAGSIAFSSREPTAEEGRYDAIFGLEIIVTITFFTFFGSILPVHAWAELGIWRLIIYSLVVIFFRRLPVVLAMSRFIPELQREKGGQRSVFFQALFAGFYGPIGVGGLFYTTFSQEKLGEESSYHIVCFVVLMSVLIHGIPSAPLARLLFRNLNRAKQLDESIVAPADVSEHEDGPYIPAPPEPLGV